MIITHMNIQNLRADVTMISVESASTRYHKARRDQSMNNRCTDMAFYAQGRRISAIISVFRRQIQLPLSYRAHYSIPI